MNGAHPYQDTSGYPMQQPSFHMPSSNEAAISLAAQAMSMFSNAQLPGFDMQQMQQMQNGFPGPLASPGLVPNNLFPPLPFPGMPFPHPLWTSAFQGFPNMAPFQPTVTQPFMAPASQGPPLIGHQPQGAGDNGPAMRGSDREEGELSDAEMKSPTKNNQVPAGREGRGPPRGPRAHQRRSINGHAAGEDRNNQHAPAARKNEQCKLACVFRLPQLLLPQVSVCLPSELARAKKVPLQPPKHPKKSIPSCEQPNSSRSQTSVAHSWMVLNGTQSNGNPARSGQGDERPAPSSLF